MIHDILKILDKTELHELEKQRITTDLLRVFNIAGQIEQLKAFAQFLYTKEYLVKRSIDEAIDEFERSL